MAATTSTVCCHVNLWWRGGLTIEELSIWLIVQEEVAVYAEWKCVHAVCQCFIDNQTINLCEVIMPDYINPGEELRDYLSSFYSQPSPNFLQQMDNDLMCEGELAELVYDSCLNYLLRRLIKTAEYYRRHDPSDWRMKLKGFLRDHTRLRTGTDELIRLLSRCLDAMQTEPTQLEKKQIRQRARENGHRCYLCGDVVEFQETDSYLAPSLDHMWPRATGGTSQRDNLRIAHQKCNSKLKRDFIDASDYHYEQICAVSTPDDKNFTQEMTPLYRMAVFARSNFACAVCDQPAFRVGTLRLGRVNPADSWHFLNLQGYCEKHLPNE